MPNLLQGTVTKTGAMAKTITVTLTRRFEHPKILKEIERTKKILVHDELCEARTGDRVTISHTRPISRRKNFQLASIDGRYATDPETGKKSIRSVAVEGRLPVLPKMTVGSVTKAIEEQAAR